MTGYPNSGDAYYEKQQEIIDDLLAALEKLLAATALTDIVAILPEARAAILKARGET